MTSDKVKSVVSANIQLTASPDELTAINPASRSTQTMILGSIFCIFLLFECGNLTRQAVINSHTVNLWQSSEASFISKLTVFALPLFLFVVFSWLIFQFVRLLFGSKQILHCTREIIEITFIDFGRPWRTRQFIIGDVKRIEFASVGFSKYGAILGLKFKHKGKNIKFFAGLKAVEAEVILREIKRLGGDTLVDPAMRMMVEIENSRR